MSIDRRTNKHDVVVYIKWDVVQLKKEGILPFATTHMDLESTTLSKISQTGKDKCCMSLVICGIEKSQTYREQTGGARGRKTRVGKGGRMETGDDNVAEWCCAAKSTPAAGAKDPRTEPTLRRRSPV